MVSPLHPLPEAEALAALLQTGLTVRVRAKGGSMKPIIRSGNVIRIVPAPAMTKVGDIILYRVGSDRVVAHRLLRQTENHLWTKGDAWATEDERVDRSQVLGRVVAVEEPFFLPLDGFCARTLGRLVGYVFPKLVGTRAAVARVLSRKVSRA